MMFQPITSHEINALTNPRDGERKIGQDIILGNIEQLSKKGVKYVLFGVQESIGPRANFGLSGAENAWLAFLKAFLNMQENSFSKASQIGLLGSFKFDAEKEDIEALRLQIQQIDIEISNIVNAIASHNMIPILVGGGHNNAYPLIKGVSQAYGGAINAINCDPHADFRPLEGRHSGNGFSYAMEDGYLDKYFMLGLHQNYNGQSIYEQFDKANEQQVKVLWTYFDNWIYAKSTLEHDLEIGIEFVGEKRVGIELDMDAIACMPSSAMGPSGISLNEARRYISKCASVLNSAYLHLTEAAPINSNQEKLVGKSLAYLVSDFIYCS